MQMADLRISFPYPEAYFIESFPALKYKTFRYLC